jgi:flagellar hook-basal body complex protein FliE
VQIDAIVPDTAPSFSVAPVAAPAEDAEGFAALVDALGAPLARADHAEQAFAAGNGGLLEMVTERARADITLQIATAAAQRGTQAINTILGMAV